MPTGSDRPPFPPPAAPIGDVAQERYETHETAARVALHAHQFAKLGPPVLLIVDAELTETGAVLVEACTAARVPEVLARTTLRARMGLSPSEHAHVLSIAAPSGDGLLIVGAHDPATGMPSWVVEARALGRGRPWGDA